MLKRLSIQNLAVVEDVVIELDDGLNVLTGSTGAGKSLILGAVNLLLGERASAQLIRAGADRAVVEGGFILGSALDKGPAGMWRAGDQLLLRREVYRNGRSTAFVDNQPCPVKQLRAVASELIEPHGQNEQLQLKNVETHRLYLDVFAGNSRELAAYADALGAYEAAARDLAEFDARIAATKEKRELLEHRIDELRRADLVANEKADVEDRLCVLENAQAIFETLSRVLESLHEGENAAAGVIAQGRGAIRRLGKLDSRLDGIASQLETAEVTLNEAVSDMRTYLDRLEFEPGEHERLQERLAVLTALERRYQMTIEELIAARDAWIGELEAITFEDEERGRLQDAVNASEGQLRQAAARLTKTRTGAAKRLDAEITRELGELMMPGARFRTIVEPAFDGDGTFTIDGRPVRLRPDGVDAVVFWIRTNPGEAPGQVSETASSGELSRVALALKKVVGMERAGSVLILDEIDAGVGADLGGMIAEKLARLAQRYQIICITHMAQIAARARRHLVVAKLSASGRTRVTVHVVEGDSRLQEVARMLGGATGSDKRLALAAEMLQEKKTTQPTNVRP